MLRLVVTILAALSATVAATVADTPVERGAYLVNAVMACDGCHTPRPPGAGFDMGKRFSGGSQTWDTPRYLVKGSNISPDSETGIGKWSDADFKRALTEGVRPSGVSLVPQMPFVFYKVLTPNDLYSRTALIERIRAFGEHYSALGKPFASTFTRQELERQLRNRHLHLGPSRPLHVAA